MPTLSWIGKDAVVNHHREVPYRLLRDVPELGCGDPGSGNLLVEGDNLHALKALLPYYAGQVKCIYIDPPYNTGNEGWVYNDAVNSPLIQKWLGETVGKEAEDLSRHDKWLCMMYPRLQLLKQFLREDGVIFISIDDIELNHLCFLMDEIFGRDRRLAIFTWVRKKKGSNLSKEFRKVTEYVVAYKNSPAKIELHGAPAYDEKMVPLINRPNPVGELIFPAGKLLVGRGVPDGVIYPGVKGEDKGELAVTLDRTIRVENGVIADEFKLSGRWRWSQATVDDELMNGSRFVVSKDFRINVARHNQSEKFKAPSSLLSPDDGIPTNEDATDELRDIFSDRDKLPFDYPKPSGLVSYLVRSATQPGDIVLDAFAGSGTAAHATLFLNSQAPTDAPRRFVVVQMPHETAEQQTLNVSITRDVTAERIRRVANGYTNAKGEAVAGLGGGFRYCRLDAPLFSAAGVINPDVRFAQLARHVYFTETGEPLPRERVPNTPLVGVHRGTAVYLLFNGILGDKSRDGGNVLTRALLAQLPPHDGPKVIFAYGCLLGEDRMRAERLTFRQTPYEIAIA